MSFLGVGFDLYLDFGQLLVQGVLASPPWVLPNLLRIPPFSSSPPPPDGIMGPDQHAQLDGFGLTLPFPIRIAALLAAGKLIDSGQIGHRR